MGMMIKVDFHMDSNGKPNHQSAIDFVYFVGMKLHRFAKDMLKELQMLSNSFHPDTASSSSEVTELSVRRDSYLQHPTDPAYSRNLSNLKARNDTADSFQSDIQSDENHRVQSGSHDTAYVIVQDPQAQRTSFASGDSHQVNGRPRHAVFQDPVVHVSSGHSRHTQSDELPARSHRQAVYGDVAAFGVSEAKSTEQTEGQSESDADVQQILRDLRDNESSHVAFDDDVDSLEGLEDSESESYEESEESSDADDVNVDME